MVSLEDHLLGIVRPGLHPGLYIPVYQFSGLVKWASVPRDRWTKGSETASLRVSHRGSPFQSTRRTVLNRGGQIEAARTQ